MKAKVHLKQKDWERDKLCYGAEGLILHTNAVNLDSEHGNRKSGAGNIGAAY